MKKQPARSPAAKPVRKPDKKAAAKRPPPAAKKAARKPPAGKLLVFVGPTLSAEEAQRLAPHAEIRPPVAVGELLTLARARNRPACVAIIDGYFERMAAVWHKEILFALERGIAVYGAASMGALRAAELAPWGMIGAGEIYRAFASGQLTADDEVAVAHLRAEHDHRAISDALVNLRDGLTRAAADGAVTQKMAKLLLEAAARRHYRERSWRQTLEDGTALGLTTEKRNQLATWLARHRPDLKAADARALLTQLATAGWQPPPPIAVPRTWAFEQLVQLLDER
jgi:hypothetical protein